MVMILNAGRIVGDLRGGKEDMTEKRYRTEQIQGATLPFIVDNYSAKKHKTMTGYKAYSTTTVKECDELTDLLNNYEKENEQLKSELSRYKEVNRLDIWKSSYSLEDALITELQDKCNKKQEHIVLLENKIHRMREAIHKLEWLATHRNGELIRENEQLKYDRDNCRKQQIRQANKIHEVSDENEQLKQRNENQYNQLKQLWELIEKEDYNTLRNMLNQRETDEKLLQSEWRTYCD